MDLDQALRDLSDALSTGNGARDRLRHARRFLIATCLAALGSEPAPQHSLPGVIQLVAASANRAVQRDCAILLVHALAVPRLVPAEARNEFCALAEDTLRSALLRCGYPFGGSIEARLGVLEGLSSKIAELMEPLEPTFPNWQGLYAG
jgi:hypothetical protein